MRLNNQTGVLFELATLKKKVFKPNLSTVVDPVPAATTAEVPAWRPGGHSPDPVPARTV